MAAIHQGKPCPKCGGTERYASDRSCVPCRKRKVRERAAAGYFREHGKRTQRAAKRWEAAKADPELHEKTLAKCRLGNKRYYQKNKAAAKERCAHRRARKRQATPQWVDRELLRVIYQNAPPGHEVDHIVPLAGENVCGLHVPWNLQYLPVAINRSKGSTFAH